MRTLFVSTLQTFAGLVVAMGIILVAIYPHRPDSAVGWLMLALVAIPVVLGLQFIGAFALQNRIMERLGTISRIALGVVFVLLLALLISVAWYLIEPTLGTW